MSNAGCPAAGVPLVTAASSRLAVGLALGEDLRRRARHGGAGRRVVLRRHRRAAGRQTAAAPGRRHSGQQHPASTSQRRTEWVSTSSGARPGRRAGSRRSHQLTRSSPVQQRQRRQEPDDRDCRDDQRDDRQAQPRSQTPRRDAGQRTSASGTNSGTQSEPGGGDRQRAGAMPIGGVGRPPGQPGGRPDGQRTEPSSTARPRVAGQRPRAARPAVATLPRTCSSLIVGQPRDGSERGGRRRPRRAPRAALSWHSASSEPASESATTPPRPARRRCRPATGGPDGDRGVGVAGEVEVADDAAVQPAPGRLQLVDDLHRPRLRRPGQRAGREAGRHRVEAVRPARSRPVTVETMCMTWL